MKGMLALLTAAFISGSVYSQAPDKLGHQDIGDSYQGGKVVYILQPGDPGYDAKVQHGIIVSPNDQSTGAEWGCVEITISGADSTGIGTGKQNTIDITNGCSQAGIAAKLCSDLVLNGYSDWYLPSKDDLNKLYITRAAIGGYTENFYWSSSEGNGTYSWGQDFYDGTQAIVSKDSAGHVRAVRLF